MASFQFREVREIFGFDAVNLTTSNATHDIPAGTAHTDIELTYPPWASTLIVVLMAVVIFGTLFGNILVILSVCRDRRLRKPPNFLIINLAISDLAVALLDMPLAAAFDVKGLWVWGPVVCDLWIFIDVLACTASIMTLCMISVDRYLAISRPMTYAKRRTSRLMIIFILIVWVTSVIIGIQPLFLWGGNVKKDNVCLISQDPAYTIVSTVGAFYLPLTVMLLVYAQIYRVARKSELADLKLRSHTAMLKRTLQDSVNAEYRKQSADSTACSAGSWDDNTPNDSPRHQERRQSVTRIAEFILARARFSSGSINTGPGRISLKRERKAAKTLGVIMGAFILCWLPFFIVALLRPYCGCIIPPQVSAFLLWLGFINSLLNPIIYPSFNKDFRPAYRRMLCWCVHFRKGPNSDPYNKRQVTFRQMPTPIDEQDEDSDALINEDGHSPGHFSRRLRSASMCEPQKIEAEVNGNLKGINRKDV